MKHMYRRDYSSLLKEATENYLKSKGLEYSLDEKTGYIEFSRDTGTELGVLDYKILINKEGITIYEFLPLREEIYTRKGREELLSFLISASFGEFGCWLMDIRDTGEIAYKMYCDWGTDAPDERWNSWLDRYFQQMLISMQNYLPGFEDIIHHGTSSRFAMDMCIKNMLMKGMEI